MPDSTEQSAGSLQWLRLERDKQGPADITVKSEPVEDDDGWIEGQTADTMNHEQQSMVIKIEPMEDEERMEEAGSPPGVSWRVDENEAEEMEQDVSSETGDSLGTVVGLHPTEDQEHADTGEHDFHPGILSEECHLRAAGTYSGEASYHESSETSVSQEIPTPTTPECNEKLEGLESAGGSNHSKAEIEVENVTSIADPSVQGMDSGGNIRKESLTTAAVVHNDGVEELVVSIGEESITEDKASEAERPFACSACPRKYKTSSTLKRHLKSHFSKGIYRCEFCEKSFSRKDLHTKHQQIHQKREQSETSETTSETPIFKCNSCLKTYTTLANLKRHVKNNHREERLTQRAFCKESSSTTEQEQNQEWTHQHEDLDTMSAVNDEQETDEIAVKIEEDDRAFDSSINGDELGVDTFGKVLLSDDSSVSCSKEEIGAELELMPGKREQSETKENTSANPQSKVDPIHNSAEEECDSQSVAYQCCLCPKTYTTLSNVKRHLKKFHAKEELMQGTFCEESFSTTEQEQNHEWTHQHEGANTMTAVSDAQKSDEIVVSIEEDDSVFDSSGNREELGIHSFGKVLLSDDSSADCNKEESGAKLDWMPPKELVSSDADSTENTEDLRISLAVDDNMDTHEIVLSVEDVDDEPDETPETDDMSVDWDESKTNEEYLQIRNEGIISLGDTLNETISNGERLFKCSSCPKVYATPSNLKRHLKSHTGERPYPCTFCDKSFSTTDKQKNHIRIHTGEKPHQCRFCEKRFIYSDKLKSHERLHTGERPFPCNFCDQAFITRDKWRQHTRKKHAGQGLYLCKFCDASVGSKMELMKHEKDHTGFIPHQCKYCGVTCSSSSNLNRHMRNHTGERPYQCRFCDKAFAIRNYLTNHERLHEGDKKYECSYCQKRFVATSALAIHERVHTGQRPFKCQYCEKSFVRRDALKHHEGTHTGNRPFRCKLCDKAYTTSPHLRVHERTHSKDRPYKCRYCGKGFTTSDKWRIHERIHTGEKPYQCNFCEQRFINSTYLRRHERSRHKDMMEPAGQSGENEPTAQTVKI